MHTQPIIHKQQQQQQKSIRLTVTFNHVYGLSLFMFIWASVSVDVVHVSGYWCRSNCWCTPQKYTNILFGVDARAFDSDLSVNCSFKRELLPLPIHMIVLIALKFAPTYDIILKNQPP